MRWHTCPFLQDVKGSREPNEVPGTEEWSRTSPLVLFFALSLVFSLFLCWSVSSCRVTYPYLDLLPSNFLRSVHIFHELSDLSPSSSAPVGSCVCYSLVQQCRKVVGESAVVGIVIVSLVEVLSPVRFFGIRIVVISLGVVSFRCLWVQWVLVVVVVVYFLSVDFFSCPVCVVCKVTTLKLLRHGKVMAPETFVVVTKFLLIAFAMWLYA